jgi:CubicO group peptidase (beta-lactamase class C family)
MTITRRGAMAASLALAGASGVRAAEAAASSPAPRTAAGSWAIPQRPPAEFTVGAPGAGTRDYTAALAALNAYARAELDQIGLPGMTIAVTDADGFTAVLPLGWADVAARRPVRAADYFQIGSISKSFIALTILALADQGRIDLAAPVARYLPDAPLPHEPITIKELLSHASGLPDGAPIFPRTPDARLWCGYAPGSRFSYSNTGFQLLGRVIERVAGEPHQTVADRLVRQKLGLGAVAGVISQARRAAFAVGYWPWNRVDGHILPGGRLESATFDEEDNPAGSIGASAGEMAIYLQALMRFARGQGGPVLSDASARRFATPVIAAEEFGAGARYALGIAVQPVDGVDCLHHTGGMMSFASSFHADPVNGVACFASVNAMLDDELYRPRQVTRYAVQLMRAVRAGAPLPAAPDALSRWRVKDPAAWAGVFHAGPRQIALGATSNGLSLETDGRAAVALGHGEGRLITDHPALAGHGLEAVRESGHITGLWWGETLFSRDPAAQPPTSPPALRALAGVYLNRDPWVGSAVILARGPQLVAEGAGPLADRGGYWTLAEDPGGVERFRFEAPLNGRPQRLNVSGSDLLRITV